MWGGDRQPRGSGLRPAHRSGENPRVFQLHRARGQECGSRGCGSEGMLPSCPPTPYPSPHELLGIGCLVSAAGLSCAQSQAVSHPSRSSWFSKLSFIALPFLLGALTLYMYIDGLHHPVQLGVNCICHRVFWGRGGALLSGYLKHWFLKATQKCVCV